MYKIMSRACSNGVSSIVTASLCIAAVIAVSPAFADMKGNFPGKGDRETWKKASQLSIKAKEEASKKHYDKAVKMDQAAIKMYPDDSSFYFNAGQHLERAKKYSEAEENLRKSVEMEPAFDNWMSLAIAQGQQKKWNEAEQSLEHASKLAETPEQKKILEGNEKWIHESKGK